MDPGSMALGGGTPSDINEAIAWLNLAATVGLTLFIFVSRRYQATRDQITALEQSVSDEVRKIHARLSTEIRNIDTRLTRVEEWRQTVPGHVDVEKLYTQLEVVKGDLREMSSGVKSIGSSVGGVQRSIALINEHLLHQDKQISRTIEGDKNDG